MKRFVILATLFVAAQSSAFAEGPFMYRHPNIENDLQSGTPIRSRCVHWEG